MILTTISALVSAIFAVLLYFKGSSCDSKMQERKARKLSLGVAHLYPKFAPESFDENSIELTIANTTSSKNAIKNIDWALSNSPRKSPVKCEIQFPYLLPKKGILITNNLQEIMPHDLPHISGNLDLALALRGLILEVTLMTNERHYMPVPICLKINLYRFHARKTRLYKLCELAF